MSHPSVHARTDPGKPALIVAETGERVSFAELDARSNRAAHLFRAKGLQAGDTIALCLENSPAFYDIAWGAQRAGLFFVCISTKLTAPEIEYILEDSGARLVIVSASLAGVTAGFGLELARFSVGGPAAGWAAWEDAVAALPDTPIADERAGIDMLYSSGTTGRPKGVRVALPADPDIAAGTVLEMLARGLYGLGPDSLYLSPAPLYHAAPLRWSMTVQRLGGTVVMMEHFDPEAALAAIERYHINASQWVPTHFVRMLKLDPATRARHDLSSLKVAIHAAAPCPIPVKEAMIDWWGPVLYEYYAVRGQWPDDDRLARMAGAQGVGRQGGVRRAPHLRRGWRRASAGRAGAGLFRGRHAVRIS
jgi:long-chain acyl-CoA synthetase